MAEVAQIQTTNDALFDGALALRQPAKRTGYRVNVDAILLAAFAAHRLEGAPTTTAKRVRHAVDLGSGVGAVGLTLLHLNAAHRVSMLEIDPALSALAKSNAEENDWIDRIDVIEGSVALAPKTLHADLVVCNPPYVMPGRGRAPATSVRSAKYGELSVFVEAARRISGKRARTCFVYPAIEMTTLLTVLRANGLEPKRLRLVHARATDKARVVLVDCAIGKPGGLEIEPPFVEMEGRTKTPALARLLSSPRA